MFYVRLFSTNLKLHSHVLSRNENTSMIPNSRFRSECLRLLYSLTLCVCRREVQAPGISYIFILLSNGDDISLLIVKANRPRWRWILKTASKTHPDSGKMRDFSRFKKQNAALHAVYKGWFCEFYFYLFFLP